MLKKSITDYSLDPDDVLLRDLIVDELYASEILSRPTEIDPVGDRIGDSGCGALPTSAASRIEEIGWIISNCDQEDMTEAVTAQEEFDRLQVLKKYTSVDVNNDDTLNSLTSMASLIFRHDYSWILLMDLRTSWIISSQGLGELNECPRSLYFPCAHTLRTKRPVLMVENLIQDPRFIKSPFANGPFGARFYAAAPLISPEGFRIGVFGVASKRPSTMSTAEQALLSRLADLTMRHLVEKRRKVDLEENLKKAIACTSHDIMTPLMGLQLSLASLKDDKELDRKLDVFQREALTTAEHCVSTMCHLGTTAMQDVHEGLANASTNENPIRERSQTNTTPCQVSELVDRIHQVRHRRFL